ncbi:MAG TPA: hypothetical protein DCL15_11620 [Chloroflexi bacterium]|nr:hypothetical protein [Chloroflexota bacterium]HHW84962.1 hypothetical protein [Chloroflexota bacterium]
MARTINYVIPAELERSEAIAATPAPPRHTPLRAVAERLTRRGVAAAKAELVNNAVLTLVNMVYETDEDGVWSNVDGDGRVLIPLPWGRLGYRHWGLRRTEANALRWLMMQRAARGEPWLVYDGEARCWLLNLAYPTRRTALAYWRQLPITLAEWRAASDATRSQWADQHLTK